jgi:hypothetical protein
VSILPVEKSQSAVREERSLKLIVDYRVSGKRVGAFVVPRCAPNFVFGWDSQGTQPSVISKKLRLKN